MRKYFAIFVLVVGFIFSITSCSSHETEEEYAYRDTNGRTMAAAPQQVEGATVAAPTVTPIPSPPNRILADIGYATVMMDGGSTFALTSEGILWAWGSNARGQLGIGTIYYTHYPTPVMENVQTVNPSWWQTFAVCNNNILWAWGYNLNRPLGDGTRVNRSEPYALMENVISVYNMRGGNFVIDRYNTLWVLQRTGPVVFLKNVATMVYGYDIGFAITTNGELWSWGSNTFGRLGDDSPIGLSRREPSFVMSNVIHVEAFLFSVFAITENGELWAWGANEGEFGNGQLGDGTSERRNYPVRIMDNVASVHTISPEERVFALKTNGELWGWGVNRGGELGDGTMEFQSNPVPILDNVVSFYVGDVSNFALRSDNTLWGWSRSWHLRERNPTQIAENVVYFTRSSNTFFAIKESGELYSWGNNSSGVLGDGTTERRTHYERVRVMGDVVSIYLLHQDRHVFAITANSVLWAWGANQKVPVQIMCLLGTGRMLVPSDTNE